MEREALKQKHQNEIAAFHQQQFIQQLQMKSSKFRQIPSSPTVSASAATAVYPITYQPVTPVHTGNSGIFICLKQCVVLSG